MKLISAAATAVFLLGLSGAAYAECSWGSNSHTTTAESDTVIILPEADDSLGS